MTSSSTNYCKWKKYKNKQLGEYFTCNDANDNIYKAIHLAKYPKKGCAFDKEKLKNYKEVIGKKKKDLEDVDQLIHHLKKLKVQLYDNSKQQKNDLKKGYKLISKGKNGWKPIVPVTSLFTSKQQRGGKFCKFFGTAAQINTSCDVLCSMKENRKYYEKLEQQNKRKIQILEKCFSLGDFPDDFESFDQHLKTYHSTKSGGYKRRNNRNKKGGAGANEVNNQTCTQDNPFLFFSNTNAFINRTLWGDTNDDKTPIVPYTPTIGKRKREEGNDNLLGDVLAINEWMGVLKILFSRVNNQLNILNIVTAPLHYIVPLNLQSAVADAPREWEKRGDVVKRIADSVLVLKKLFKLNSTTSVNVINLHLYSPEVEMYNYMHIAQDYREEMLKNIKTADPNVIFTNEVSFQKYFTDEIKSQITEENEKTRQYYMKVKNISTHDKFLYFCNDGTIFGTNDTNIQQFIEEMKINMIYCAGGETHWLHRQLKANGMFEILKNNKHIIWSGFSAGIINAGYTTAMAAEKILNPIANPDRKTGKDAPGDDITALQKKIDGTKECDVYEVNTTTDPPSVELKITATPDDCDTKAANWYCKGIVYPHFRDKWAPMILDVLSRKQDSDHFRDVEKIMILADGECVHNLRNGEGTEENVIERLPSQEVINAKDLTQAQYFINSARCFSEAINTNINRLPPQESCETCPPT